MVSHDGLRSPAAVSTCPSELVEEVHFRTSEFECSVQRDADCEPRQLLGDVVGGDGLNLHRWQPDEVGGGDVVDQLGDELVEQGGAKDEWASWSPSQAVPGRALPRK